VVTLGNKMIHRKKGYKLSRTTKVRQSLFKNQLRSLLTYGSIKTTYAKAKALRPLAETFCHKAMAGNISSRRYMYSYLGNRHQVIHSETALKTAFGSQSSNFIKISRLQRRPGDDALIAKIAFTKPVDFSIKPKKAVVKKTPVKKPTSKK